MSLYLSCIVGGVNEQNSIVKNVRTDDWKAELFASNEENCDNVFNEHILLFLNTEHWQLNDNANPPFDKKI